MQTSATEQAIEAAKRVAYSLGITLYVYPDGAIRDLSGPDCIIVEPTKGATPLGDHGNIPIKVD